MWYYTMINALKSLIGSCYYTNINALKYLIGCATTGYTKTIAPKSIIGLCIIRTSMQRSLNGRTMTVKPGSYFRDSCSTTVRPLDVRLSDAVSQRHVESASDTTSSQGVVRQHDGRSYLSDTTRVVLLNTQLIFACFFCKRPR